MDNVLITMPDNTRDFMAAASVTQDYLLQLALGAEKKFRPANYEVTFRMQERFKYFEPCLKMVKDNTPIFDYTGWTEMRRGDFDCFMDFDPERAWEITKLTDKHITEAFGILIGASPSSRYPVQVNKLIRQEEPEFDVAIVNWGRTGQLDSAYRFLGFLTDNYPQLRVELILLSCDNDRTLPLLRDPKAVFDFVQKYRVVVGESSGNGITYAAAALGKGLIEIFQNQKEATLYNNFDLSIYQQVIGTNVTAEVMWSAWENKWPEIEASFITKSVAQ